MKMIKEISRKLINKQHHKIKERQKALLMRACERVGCVPNWDVILNRKVTPDQFVN